MISSKATPCVAQPAPEPVKITDKIFFAFSHLIQYRWTLQNDLPPIWLPYPPDSSVKNIKETQLGKLSPAPQPFPSLGPWSLTYYWYFDIFDILSLLLLLLFVLHLWVYQNFVYSKSHRWRIVPYYNHTSSTTFICVITKKKQQQKLTNKNGIA